MDYALMPWLIAGGALVALVAVYIVIRIVVRIIRFLTR